jgi:hypothetical protein
MPTRVHSQASLRPKSQAYAKVSSRKSTGAGKIKRGPKGAGKAAAKYPATAERIAWGGVSPVPQKAAGYGLQSVSDRQGPKITAAANPKFSWHGGPIVANPQVFSSFWGPTWTKPANQKRATRLNQYLKDLLQSKYMNILTQYGVGQGAGAGGSFIKSTFVNDVPPALTDKKVARIIQQGIDNGTFPEPGKPTNNVLMIFLGEGIAINDPASDLVLCNPIHDSAFGYHSFFKTTKGHPFYYSIVPSLNKTCITATCPSDADCSLHLSEDQEQRQTQVASHEFAEMVTDPQLNAWFDASTGSENGDICNGESGTIKVGPNTWTVQRMYSKFDDVKSNGASFSLTEPANPIPRLSPGPPAAHASGVGHAQSGEAEVGHLLPLPTVHFDTKSGKARMDPRELRDYVKQIFAPLGEQQVITDLAAFLKEAADSLSKKQTD